MIWASRFALPSVALASGYPLHHPLRLRRGRGQAPPLRVVPLLSLSQSGGFAAAYRFASLTFCIKYARIKYLILATRARSAIPAPKARKRLAQMKPAYEK
jgi:hypothetical protein